MLLSLAFACAHLHITARPSLIKKYPNENSIKKKENTDKGHRQKTEWKKEGEKQKCNPRKLTSTQ